MKKRDFKSPGWLVLHPKWVETHFGNRNPSLREDVKEKIGDSVRRVWAAMSDEKRKEIILKRSIKMKGDKNPAKRLEVREKMRSTALAHHNHQNKGIPKSEEHKRKNRLAHMGKKWTLEQTLKMSEVSRNRTKETCPGRRSQAIKISGENNPSKRLEVKEKKKQTYLKNYGIDSYSKTDEFRNNSIIRMKNGGAALANSGIKSPSKPQIQLFEQTKILYPSAILNYSYLNYSIDVAIPDQKIAIEYDGSYWHQNGEKDRKRQSKLELNGWKFIRYKDYIPSSEELLKSISEMETTL